MKKNYYAIIPAGIRYSKELSPSAKLLYGELTALANQEGYSWATNDYYAELYGVEPRTIQRWLAALKRLGYIQVKKHIKENSQEVRHIYINDTPAQEGGATKKTPQGGDIKDTPPYDKKDTHNNTVGNSTDTTTMNSSRPASLKNLKKDCREYFEATYKSQKGQDYYWAGKDAKALGGLIQKINFTIKSQGGGDSPATEATLASFKAIALAVFEKGDTWQKNNISLTLLNSQYNQIITRYGNTNRAHAFNTINQIYTTGPGR